ncbi:MAG: Thiol:disulfide interchange protein DsbD [Phycisphaerae bacterium]|nr:Thiol:disulfide interchange protein DsbD [Phycisphaerae bacterium]
MRMILASIFVGTLLLSPAQADQPKAAASDIYPVQADAARDIAQALQRAQQNQQRVLLMYGGNWCGWCHKLHALFNDNPAIAKLLQSEYQLVMIDIGQRDKNMELARKYGADVAGVPYLTVLDADGKVLVNQETGSLEAGDHHDPAKVQAFLEQWQAPRQDAQQLFDTALKETATTDRQLMVLFSTPWCSYCKHMKAFLTDPAIQPLLTQDYQFLWIDVERMTHGMELAQKISQRQELGWPWFALVDSQGKAAATSETPQGNIGYPVAPEEISHFMSMIRSGAKKISSAQLEQIEKELQRRAAELKSNH